MAEDQQKNTAEDTVEVPDVQDDTPEAAEADPQEAEAMDTSTKEVHPENTADAVDADVVDSETPTGEPLEHAAEAAQEAGSDEETVAEAATDEAAEDGGDGGLLQQAVDTVKQAASDAAEAVSEVVDEVVGGDGEAGDDGDDGRLLEQAVEEAVSTMDVPSAREDDLIIGGVREPITSVEGAGALSGTVGYTGEIVGRVVKLEDLQDTLEDEETGPQYDQLAALIEETLTDVSEHEIVVGRVVSVGEKEVVVDFGFKSDGVVAKNEFDRELEPGDEVEVYLERIEDYHGQPVISKTKADKYRRWERVEDAFENEKVLEGTIVRRIKGGMIVELDIGQMEAFLPGSQIDVRPVRDFDAYLEKRMEFKIVKINPANENVVVSHKALIEKELEAQRDKILSTMEAGQILEGTVKNITDFGVFIDLGGVDGLLHITDLSWGRVSHPSELVDLDEKMKVVVLDYDKERQRISLGLKQLQPHPWENINEKFDEGETVEGKVVSITDYGAFVELEKGIEGLVHISEMSWTDHIRHPSQKVSLGQLVNVRILNIDHEGKKISLGMKQLEANPWVGLSDRYPPGTVLRGKVRNITNFGVFVEIEPGIDGLVHISDLSWTKKVKHPSEMIKKGQDLDVVILDIDEDRQRISLGHKQIQTNPWNDFSNVYSEGSDTKATITEVDDKGIVVELPLEVEGFVPASELKNGPANFRAYYGEGDELELRVIRFDLNNKDIVLSEIAKDRAEERTQRQAEERERRQERDRERREVSQFQDRSATGPTTLGELSGLEELKRQMEAAEAAADTPEPDAAAAPEAEPAAEPEAAAAPAAEAEPAAETEPAGEGEQDAAEAIGTDDVANTLDDKAGMDNRGDLGKAKQDSDETEPPAEQAQRTEEAGGHPPAEKNQAALKGTGTDDKTELAEAAEDVTDDETPSTGTSEKPVAATESDVSTGELEARTKPGDTEERAVTVEAVKEQAEEEAAEEGDEDKES